ncbi:MAG: formylmethanofuran dehydrogenase subunit B [Methanomicrobiales archaeon]|nr:formylmethanofuran dehydrogenase subunit B [Methanomicrobiales archaeon]
MLLKDVVCPYCACLCDDLDVTVEGNRVTGVDNACDLGAHKFQAGNRLPGPVRPTEKGWDRVSREEAIGFTVDMLLSADRPLIYGWSTTSVEAQSLGIHIAEEIGGVVDATTSVCHGPSILAIQEVGHPGCTLGQVKNRADVVIYWGCNPIEAHPRHLSRYTMYSDGFFLENAFKERTLIVADIRPTESANVADEFVHLKRGGDYAVLSALRAIVRGKTGSIPSHVAGVSRAQLLRIGEVCKNAKYGAFFFGMGLTQTVGKYKNIRNAIELVDELNRHTKWTLTPMRGHFNVYGFNEVCTWVTGYPYAVDFSRGMAFYNPGETTAVDILARKECDACLVVASDPAAHFPRAAVEHLAEIPVVQIDPVVNATTAFCDLQIPVAVTGIDAEGTAYRMDGVPIRAKKILDLGYPADSEILREVYQQIRDRKKVREVKPV